MITPQFQLPLHHELVIDLFAGGGGASTGIEQAIGRAVDIAINHDPEAVSLHQANHPQTAHYVSDVFEVEPLAVTQGRPVARCRRRDPAGRRRHLGRARGAGGLRSRPGAAAAPDHGGLPPGDRAADRGDPRWPPPAA